MRTNLGWAVALALTALAGEAHAAKLVAVPSLGVGDAVARADAAEKRRDEAIEQIRKILPKQKNPDSRADLLYQLAELWLEKSRYMKLNWEMETYTPEAAKFYACRREMEAKAKACGAEPQPNASKSELVPRRR